MSASLFVMLIFSGGFGLIAEEVPAEVLQAAQKGISDLPGDFLSKTSQESPVLKHGFQVFTLPRVSMLENSGLSSVLTPTGMWRFVVAQEGQPLSLITIDNIQGEWKAVAFGGAQLAAEMSKVMEQWPAEQGYNHRFARIYNAKADLVEISKGDRILGFVPLTASRLAFGIIGDFEPAALLHDSEILPLVKKATVDNNVNREEN